MTKQSPWVTDAFPGMVGTKEIEVLAQRHEGRENAQVILFRYKGKDRIHALRWSIGAVLDMHTDNVDDAMGGIDAMLTMEESGD